MEGFNQNPDKIKFFNNFTEIFHLKYLINKPTCFKS